MKTPFNEIVRTQDIGKEVNEIKLNDILRKANEEQLKPAFKNEEKVMFLAIDVQNDFMDKGALGVPGAHEDVERMTRFIYDNMDYISKIAVSIDTHIPHQIFHPCWWIDENGNNPDPYTVITLSDLDAGKYRAIINPLKSREYVENLEKNGKKVLCVWPYHCIQGTFGNTLENQFSNMVYFHSVAKKTVPERLVKGYDPLSEMYGIFRKEYDYGKNEINLNILNKMEEYDKIIIAGEAKSHCVLESVKQMLEYYEKRPEITSKVFILEDCMSSIPGYEAETDQTFENFKKKYHVNIVKSTEFSLA